MQGLNNLIIRWNDKKNLEVKTDASVEPGKAYAIKVDGKPIEVIAMNVDTPASRYQGGTIVPVPRGKVVRVIAAMDYPGDGRVTTVPLKSTSGRIRVEKSGRLALAGV